MIIRIGFSLGSLLAGLALGQDVLKPLTVTGKKINEEKGWSNGDLQFYQAEQVKDLLGVTPGFSSVSSDTGGFGDTLTVRGSANTLFFGPAGVGMVVDDVPSGDVYSYSTDFFDLESLQLLRGPQGTRYGRNAAGGMIVMNTGGAPSSAKYKLSAEYGNYEAYTLRFKAAGPISDQWSYSFQTYYKERDGYVRNTTLGRRTDDRERFGGLANLFYQPSGDLEIRLRAMYEQVRDGSQRLTAIPGAASPFMVDPLLANGPFAVASDLGGETEIERSQLSLHVTQGLGWGTFKSITSYQDWSIGPNTADLDLSPLSLSTSSIFQDQTLITQEFRLESKDWESLRWQAGLFYWNKDTDGDAARLIPTPGGPLTQVTMFDQEEDRFAFYGNAQIDSSDKLTWDFGARVEYVESEISRGKGPAFLGVPSFSGKSEDWLFSPSLGLSYKSSDTTTFFARSSIGMKPSGFTAFSDNPTTTPYDEELSWENEIGIRLSDRNDRWDVELRGYLKKIDDYQLNRSVPFSTDFVILNADEVTAYGLEFEGNWRPVDHLTVKATAGWNQTEFDDHIDPFGGGSLDGNTVPFVPEFTASLGARYDFGNGFFIQSSIKSVGTTYFDDFNTSNFKQGSYELINAQIGYEAENWSAVLFGRNLLDEDYYTFINPQIAAGSPGDPALFGVRVDLEF